MSLKQLPIQDFIIRRTAQQQSSFFGGNYHYKGEILTPSEFELKYGTKHIEQVTSINFKGTGINPDKTKID